MKKNFTKMLSLATALFAIATTLTGCFPEDDNNVFTTGDVIFEGKVTDYWQKPITKVPDQYVDEYGHKADSVMVILYRKMEKDQTFATTPANQICDTMYVDALTGKYQVKDENLTEVSNVYGLYIRDAVGVFNIVEREFLTSEARVFERNGKYEFVTNYDCILYPLDWPGLE
jgi:hypothetical protein